jgi:hypothetical protein
MASEASAQREKQEQSIKARKNELFVEEEVQTGPRKKMRDYLKETPAAPLSKNVKLMLWGSAAPVVLLFVAALLVPRRSQFKPPEESVVPVHQVKPTLASRSDNRPPAVAGPAANAPGPNAAAKSDKPAQDKAKAKKPKGKSKPKAKPKPKPKDDETNVAQNAEGGSPPGEKPREGDKGEGASTEKPRDQGKGKGDTAKNSSKTGAAPTDAKGKTTTPPKKKAAPILAKKPKVYNPAYPPRTPTGGEKKPDSDADPGLP